MAFTLRDDPDFSTQENPASGERGEGYQVSADPVRPASSNSGRDRADATLPRNYGSQTLVLMPRDPHSLFAYWDIDWTAVFPEESPRERQVQLRILDGAGAELLTVEIEAMAGSCNVDVPHGRAAYSGEIGYLGSADAWTLIARSEAVITPPDESADGDATDFATVPFHLSFQRMVDLLRVTKAENGSLTGLLGSLREQAAAADAESPLTPEQRELARAMEDAGVWPDVDAGESAQPDLWEHQKLERVLGFGTSSPTEGFGGSSRAL